MASPERDPAQKGQERPEEPPAEPSHQACMTQDCFYHEDTHCPCYMCNNHGIDTKPSESEDVPSGVEFAIRSFWRIAKTQNDIESPMEGNAKGFHYRLLLHPRGTAGTDSESSHLSVFVEAVVQDWYPEYWVFPNVRFELTVVNFKDPKQSVTSWAHWSFSSDATSRGWQKMISHARLTKAAGFMDEDGTVVIRGKAEPPYPMLWSRAPHYQPQMMWEYIADRAQREICTDVCGKMEAFANPPSPRNAQDPEDEHIGDAMLLRCLDSVVPAVSPTLDSDFLGLMVHVLYHLREFRRSVLMWNHEFGPEVSEESSMILALQKVFAYMQLYPLAVACRTYKLSAVHNPNIAKYYMYELVPKSKYSRTSQLFTQPARAGCAQSTEDEHAEAQPPAETRSTSLNCCAFDGGRFEWELGASCELARNEPEPPEDPGYRLTPGTLSHAIGERPDIFAKLLPPPPNLKPILKAMYMTDLQALEPQDQPVNLHSELFTLILRDLSSAKKLIRQRRIKGAAEAAAETADAEAKPDAKAVPTHLRDQTLLESTCKFLFSVLPENETLFRSPSINDISTAYVRCKHSNSLQKALETCPKSLLRFPQVLFFYLYPTKNAKKGELFDVPLRLDCTAIKSNAGYDNMSDSSRNTNNYDEYGVFELSEDEDDACGDFDNACEKDHGTVKWYSLYALIIKEGDLRYDGLGKGPSSFNTLLLRPEEDGPWYRMSEGRVEKLSTKMEFTEWKCHRDFFCVSAVYIAEDYIDMLQVGEVDLAGDLKQWNPSLYYATLAELGVTEQDVLTAVKNRVTKSQRTDANEENVERLSAMRGIPREMAKDKLECVFEHLHLRRVGQGHPRLATCCEIHGYNTQLLMSLYEQERRMKYEVPITRRDVMRRINRLKTITPFVSWLFSASKENTALLNGANPPADAKLLVNFLQRRERIFEEEFRHLIAELFFKEIAENAAANGLYSWRGERCACGCSCSACRNRPALLLTENGRFPGEELKLYLAEPATILFRNIQIIRCHLEYFSKDCKNITLQLREARQAGADKEAELQPIQHLLEGRNLQLQYPNLLSNLHQGAPAQQGPDEIHTHSMVKYEVDSHPTLQQIFNPHKFELVEKGGEITEFRLTSERSALFLLECIWDACVRYTLDCRTIMFLSACADEPAKPPGAAKIALDGSGWNSRDLFPLEGGAQADDPREETNQFDPKFDLTVREELDIMHHFSRRYELPTVTEMRNYLRRAHVLVYPLIRPHELLRSYLAHRHGVDLPAELERMGYRVTWNEDAFSHRARLSDLSDDELRLLGVENLAEEAHQGIGHNLCDIYEKLLTKMLVHMQDADSQVYPNCFDYVYSLADMANVVEAIQAECAKSLAAAGKAGKPSRLGPDESTRCGNSCGSMGANMHLCAQEGCVCLGHECRHNFGYSGYVLPAWVAAEMADLALYTNSQLQAYNESLIEDLSELCLKSDDKKKKKVKPRKQSIERGTCIIPPLDVKLKKIAFDQHAAHRAEPGLFLSPHAVARHHYRRGNLERHRIAELLAAANPHRQAPHVSLSYLAMLNLAEARPEPRGDERDIEDAHELRPAQPAAGPAAQRADDEDEPNRVKHAIEVGIMTTHDLFGLEGFSCETKFVPTKRLVVSSRLNGAPTKVAHLYWAVRKLISAQIPDEFLSLGASKPKKKSKCVCGQDCPDENECLVKLSWRPCAGDCFMLYALKHDVHALRTGKKFVYMRPSMDLSYYAGADKLRGPDLTVLICGAPSAFYLNGSNTWFPLQDDAEYPLLIFKWMCAETVDLVCLGAVVCDSKKQLQQYIFEWLLPIIKEMGYLPGQEGSAREAELTARDPNEDVDKYQVLEECHVRSVQNVRRWSCAIKKINKKSGDVIITQLKRTVDSPATLRLNESVMFMNSVKELFELEAMELLPDTGQFYREKWEKPEQNQPDLVSKLKKKKRKTAKAAIPSNKKSTFSKLVQPSQSKDKPEDKQDETPGEPEQALDSAEAQEESVAGEDAATDAAAPCESDDGRPPASAPESDAPEEPRVERIENLAEAVELELQRQPESEAAAESTPERDASPTAVDLNALIREGEFRKVVELCATVGLATVCDEVYRMFERELRADFVRPRKRLTNLLKLVKMMYTRVSGPEPVRQMVRRLHENYGLRASFALSHLLPDYNAAIPLMDDALQIVLADFTKFSSALFAERNDYAKSVLTHVAHALYDNAKLRDKLDSSVLFVICVVATPARRAGPESPGAAKAEPESEESDSEEAPNDADFKGLDKKFELGERRTVKENLLREADGELAKPVLQWVDDEVEQFERLVLQQLKLWWSTRQALLDKIRAAFHAGAASAKDSVAIALNNSHAGARPGRDELVLDLLEFRILLYLVDRFPELSLCFSRDSATLYFRGKLDRRAFLKGVRESRAFFGSKNAARAVPNFPIEHTDSAPPAASLMDMQLNNDQTALLLLSIKYSAFAQHVDTQFLRSVCGCKSLKSLNIPPPPGHSASPLQDGL